MVLNGYKNGSKRLKLPIINLRTYLENFDNLPVTIYDLPLGAWATPIFDVILLVKIALYLKPKKILEVGSFRGYTIKLLAEHTPPDTKLIAFDCDEKHGSAYSNLPISKKIEKWIGTVNKKTFNESLYGQYDLIYLDANHTYNEIKNDSNILIPLLSSNGIIIWHDYGDWGYNEGLNDVPEFLHELSKNIPIVSIQGSWLAAYSPFWKTKIGAEKITKALVNQSIDQWTTDKLR